MIVRGGVTGLVLGCFGSVNIVWQHGDAGPPALEGLIEAGLPGVFRLSSWTLSDQVWGCPVSHRLLRAVRFAALPALLLGVVLTVSASASSSTVDGSTTYTAPNLPVLDGDINGITTASNVGAVSAPWNTSQGDPTVGPPLPSGNLFQTYTPTSATSPDLNLAVYPAATAATPYPSGVAGTPGPLPGYCASGYPNDEGSTVVSQPASLDLPMSPYYFPDVVENGDGSLTGYFDYRPKDADEAIVAARSTDHGVTWNVTGMALDQNQGYCPTADTNDDGEGHPFVMNVAGSTDLYTLQRPAGDNTGIGLLVHAVNPAAADPLSGLPGDESVGIDPNTFVTGSVTVSSSAMPIPVSTLGSANSPEDIVAGPYEVVPPGQNSAPGSIVDCTGTQAGPPLELTGCTSSSSVAVSPGDDLVQVFATASGLTTNSCKPAVGGNANEIPYGPNNPAGTAGQLCIGFTNTTAVSPLTTYTFNVNAPNRLYLDGHTVYCVQSNANPTTKAEDCTTTTSGGFTFTNGDALTTDPIIPATAQVTTGLVAPDGIVGTLPTYPGAPSGSTVILYTEKILSRYIEGTTNASISLPASTIAYTPSVTGTEEPLPPTGTTFTVYLGTTTSAPIQAVTCTGNSLSGGIETLSGCSGGTGTVAAGNWVGGPGAAIEPYSVLEQTGEGNNGSSKGPEKLFGNNEDYTVLRAAYTTDGVNFTDLGSISGTDPNTGSTSGTYEDINDPSQQCSPGNTTSCSTPSTSGSPQDLAPGSSDSVEMRWVGSRGTIIVNPDGSYGMFLSGAWASDGDSDAFNQIFYSSSTDGEHWSVPQVVLSTDYTFAASIAQQGTTNPLGISAYYSGRAYGPSVVQNPNGTLTMVLSGYRLPKPITSDGTVLGTNTASQYTINPNDPALYRNILTLTLDSATSPLVATSTAVTSSTDGNAASSGQSITYTATVTVTAPGTGTPTGTVTFTDNGDAMTGCSNIKLADSAPDTAPCTAASPIGSNAVRAVYSGDSNYATSNGTLTQIVAKKAPKLKLTLSVRSVTVGGSAYASATLAKATSTASGTVTYTVYSDDTCTTNPIAAGTVAVTDGGVPSSNTLPFNTAGTFYWEAAYSGDSANAPTTSDCIEFDVDKATPTLKLTLSAHSIVVGNTAFASAALSKATSGAGGSVTYTVYGDRTCATSVETAGTVTVSNAVVPDSTMLTFPTAGTYYWQASYSGDGANTTATSACNELDVIKTSPTVRLSLSAGTISPGGTAFANATLTKETSTAGGTVTYTVYTDSACTTNPRQAGGGTVTMGVVPASNTLTFPTAGTVYWQAAYSGDGANAPATSTCVPLKVKA